MPTLHSTNALPDNLPSVDPDSLNAIVNAHLGETFPALSLAVMVDGQMALEEAWGWIDPETRQYPVTADALFDMASVTKLFTTTTFLSAMQANNVQLDDLLVSVVPEFGASGPRPMDGGQDPHTRLMLPAPKTSGQVDPDAVTFRHLLTHTSGLAPWRDVFNVPGAPPAAPPALIDRPRRWQMALDAICNDPFVGMPGSAVRYSDLGLMLLGESAARLHGTPGELDRAIQVRVLEPLGLDSMIFEPLRNGRDHMNIVPTEYDALWRLRRCWGEVHDENACGVGGVAGHAGLFAAARDIAALGQAWLSDDARLGITPDLMQAARQMQVVYDGHRRGLGWLLKSVKDSSAGELFSSDSYGHTGFTGTSLWVDPQRNLVVACLTNRVYPGRFKLGIHAFRRSLHDHLVQIFA